MTEQASLSAFGPAIPILRFFDEKLAYRHYLDGLGFALAWEHRFEPGMPLYAEVTRGDIRLHLSGHYGDGTPGTALWVPVADVRALYGELTARSDVLGQRPGFEEHGPGGPGFTIGDPFGNHLRFAQVLAPETDLG